MTAPLFGDFLIKSRINGESKMYPSALRLGHHHAPSFRLEMMITSGFSCGAVNVGVPEIILPTRGRKECKDPVSEAPRSRRGGFSWLLAKLHGPNGTPW
jgi:hypothetical protein